MTTAIVTGSGRGIGREIAILLARKGVNVVVCSRTQHEIDDTVRAIKQIHAGVIGEKSDVGISSQVDDLIKRAAGKFGGIDILVNNAGIFYLKKLVDTAEKEWDQTLNSNLKSAFLCSKAVLPYMMRNNSGTIINVSSGAGKTGFENLSAYCASKFGMIGLTESLAWEVAGNIRVMAICPGEVATKMQEVDPKYYKLNRDRMLKPEQVAAKIVEMIFDSSTYRNGQSVDIWKTLGYCRNALATVKQKTNINDVPPDSSIL
jgi:3-oxoacyl-[acyl-carrier protein] reductase